MSHKMHSGEMTPQEALAAARGFGRDADSSDGLDTSYDAGRAIVEEFVDGLERGETVHVQARRVLLETERYHPKMNTSVDATDAQSVGRTLAAHARGDTPDGWLTRVDVSKWAEVAGGGPTTWTIEVSEDE